MCVFDMLAARVECWGGWREVEVVCYIMQDWYLRQQGAQLPGEELAGGKVVVGGWSWVSRRGVATALCLPAAAPL